jgi:hypothetical protein
VAAPGIDLKHSDVRIFIQQRSEPRGPLGIRLIIEHKQLVVRVVGVGQDGVNAGLVRRNNGLCHDDDTD